MSVASGSTSRVMPVETVHMPPVGMAMGMLLVKRVTPPQALPHAIEVKLCDAVAAFLVAMLLYDF